MNLSLKQLGVLVIAFFVVDHLFIYAAEDLWVLPLFLTWDICLVLEYTLAILVVWFLGKFFYNIFHPNAL